MYNEQKDNATYTMNERTMLHVQCYMYNERKDNATCTMNERTMLHIQ